MTGATTSWRLEMPELLEYLEEKLHYRVRGHFREFGFDIYALDLSSWKLRFSDRTYVIWVKAEDVARQTDRELHQSIMDVTRTRNIAQHTPIVLLDGTGDFLREQFRMAYNAIFVLDEADQQAILESRRPSGEILDRLTAQMPLHPLSPYETSRPVTGSRFFGRESEIRRILQSPDTNFAIVGIRRIGKTSLLKESGERMLEMMHGREDEFAAQRLIYLDCSAFRSAEQFMQEVVRKLHTQELARLGNHQFPLFFPDFLERMSKRYGGKLVFFLDEFDALLLDPSGGSELLDVLRTTSNLGSARFIVAGFRKLLHESTNLDSPIFNFAKMIRLKELNRSDTAAMVLLPMEGMRVHIERRNEIVDRIYNETAGQPNLIQYYCSILVEHLDENDRRSLSPDDLFDVDQNEDLRSFLVNTFMDNTTNLEKAIVFALIVGQKADAQGFDLEAIEGVLADSEASGPFMDIEHACQNLVLAGVFVARGRRHHFATPIFPKILQENHNVGYLLRRVMGEGIW